MFSDEERVREWLGHIVENADRALSYMAGLDYEAWSADPMRGDAVERCLMRLTEAAIRIGDERMPKIVPDLAFHQVRGLGNMLRHEYDALDLKRLWHTVMEALPSLRAACFKRMSQNEVNTAILASLGVVIVRFLNRSLKKPFVVEYHT